MAVLLTIKNLLALDKNLDIHGIDISKESYQTAKRMLLKSIKKMIVSADGCNVENLPTKIIILI